MDPYFSEADQPWIPTLLEVEVQKANEPDDSPIDWRRFGWSALEVPSNCPEVTKRFDILQTRFNARYANRMLNSETMENWQVRLQNRFDEVVDMYERAYVLYEQNQQAMMEDVLSGTKTVFSRTDADSGSDERSTDSTTSSEGHVKTADTPDTSVNDTDGYAGAVSKSTSTNRTGGKDTMKYGHSLASSGTSTTTLTGGQIMDAINSSIDGWRDIDTRFIAEFENNFLNVWWY